MADGRTNGERVSSALRQARLTSTSTFPLEAFPPWLRAHIESVSHRLQVSADMPAAFALAVLSAAVGRTLRVRAWRGFEQPAVVWMVIAAASGENKSAVVNAMKGPVVTYQRDRKAREQPEHDEAKRRHELLKKQAEVVVGRATKGKGEATMEEAQAAIREAEDAAPSPLFRLSFDSATTEALVQMLAVHGFLAHLEGEGDVFHDIVGRYDSGGLLKQYLDGFDGEAIDLDRVGRGNISADRVVLVLGVMIQPDMLASVMGEGRFKGRGLLERCLYAMPPTLVGRRDMRALEGDEAAEAAYGERVQALCAQHHERTDGRVLVLTQDAREVFVAYRQRIEARLTTDLASITSSMNKVQGGVTLRLAGLLAVAWDQDATEVSAEVMTRAVKVMEAVFIPQAQKTFGDLRGDASGHRKRQIEPWLRTRKGVFTPRDLQQHRNDLFPTAEAAREILDGQVEDGVLVVAARQRASSTGRKPRHGYQLNQQNQQKAVEGPKPQDSGTRRREREPEALLDSLVLSGRESPKTDQPSDAGCPTPPITHSIRNTEEQAS